MKKALIVLFCAIISACALQTKHRGYVLPPDLEQQINSVKTVNQLRNLVGDPQTKTMYGEEVWIYYSATENFRGPLSHTYDDKTVLLAWVKNGQVIKTKILHDDDLPNIKIAAGETDIPAAIELNAFEELFNNVGRFSPAGLGQ